MSQHTWEGPAGALPGVARALAAWVYGIYIEAQKIMERTLGDLHIPMRGVAQGHMIELAHLGFANSLTDLTAAVDLPKVGWGRTERCGGEFGV